MCAARCTTAVVLIGDAGHGVTPATGSGMNAALEDAWLLGHASRPSGDVFACKAGSLPAHMCICLPAWLVYSHAEQREADLEESRVREPIAGAQRVDPLLAARPSRLDFVCLTEASSPPPPVACSCWMLGLAWLPCPRPSPTLAWGTRRHCCGWTTFWWQGQCTHERAGIPQILWVSTLAMLGHWFGQ